MGESSRSSRTSGLACSFGTVYLCALMGAPTGDKVSEFVKKRSPCRQYGRATFVIIGILCAESYSADSDVGSEGRRTCLFRGTDLRGAVGYRDSTKLLGTVHPQIQHVQSLHSMITFISSRRHAWLKSCKAQDCTSLCL